MQIKFENIKDKCPICEKNMKVYIGNTVMESQSCSNKCYQMIKGFMEQLIVGYLKNIIV